MLRKRVIPVVLFDGFSVLKTIEFKIRRNLGSPITVARTYNTRNVDELILLDIDATSQRRSIDLFVVKEIAAELFMPLTVGGGIRSIEDIKNVLRMGADKVAINSAAILNPRLITESSQMFGSQCIVVSVDVIFSEDKWYIYSNKGVYKDIDLYMWLKNIEELGAGEILINNVSADGLMAGVPISFVESVLKVVTIPVVYSGGVSSVRDCVSLGKTNLSGIGISSIFHFTSVTPQDCKEEMWKNNISVRL